MVSTSSPSSHTSSTPLVTWTESGLYCSEGGFYIDPHRAVDDAVVTHAHSDHARKGSRSYTCESSGVGLLKARLGEKIQVQGVPYRESFVRGNVRLSFHSAGHILGSAQVRIQRGNDVWVVSGDYKREQDPSCEPFEVVPCDTFITEATFGTPQYVWNKGQDYGKQIYDWWLQNSSGGKNSILLSYSLGKAQRILALLAPFASLLGRPVVIYDTMSALTECYRQAGRCLAPTRDFSTFGAGEVLRGELILAPPSLVKSDNDEGLGRRSGARLGEYETAFASGWMAGDSFHRRMQRGFVLSDHADWEDLNQTVTETGANRIFVLHRPKGALVRHLRQRGLEAHSVAALTPRNFQSLHEITLPLFPEAEILGTKK